MTIVPRWEWRSFGDRFGPAELALAALAPTEVVESDELYLLSVGDTDVVKVRDDLMDVKHLIAVDDERAGAVDAGDEGCVPALRGRRRARCSRPWAWQLPPR